ncbi:hypothetical protein [Yinghuangia sp. YIM S10712]|uniref:hypothetical protein n=1 Tax=Yinghuangia sp. YIM S10712 TaxID=3436930 RepID=UPI003F532FB7
MTYNTVNPASITPEMAAQIRAWRVDEEYTWRAVAQAATDLWGSHWGSNQIYGAELCSAAAKMLGEDPDQEPWN